jgi:predicted transglutaminase-like cysteine proteinase
MYSKVKKAIFFKNTALAISLLCTVAAQANVYGAPETKPGVLAQGNTPAPLAPLRTAARDGARILAWLPPARLSTTLHLAPNGLSPLPSTAFAGLAAPGLAGGAAEAPASEAAEDLPSAQDRITTASIPAAPAGSAAGRTVSNAIRQDRPLFGAHRIRFGKIMSGARISGLIRKAASTGASAICINQCAGLADRLDLGGADITAQLRHVSASVNRMVAYRTDEENHGRLDQWSTPNETLARASGDCEDYAILKMAVLARLGVPVTAMEIVVVKDTGRRLFHAVLAVALEDRTLILDNMTDAVEADTRKPGYAPLFSLSGTANYIFGYKGGKQNLTASLKNIAAIAPGAGF